MQKTVLLFLFLGIVSVASGKVMTTVYRADGNTPFEPNEVTPPITKYPDIMVRTKLKIVISSDTNEYWVGDLFIAGENRDYGFLSAASCLPDAGEEAFLYPWEDDFYQGFCFQTDENPMVGDWFTADYDATNIGDCNVGLYEWFSSDPTYELSFSHVRTRDFNKDTKVDSADLALLALYWQETNCGDANDCEETDIDIDGKVDVNDLMLFTKFWLDRTE